jgi:predicted nucleic acid-binding protein
MDVCCFNRLFDNWSQSRIRLEAEAILTIFTYCQAGKWRLINSTAIESEVERTPDLIRKQEVRELLAIAQTNILITKPIRDRANYLGEFGFKPFDALHIASAESAKVDVFLTTDDRLLRRALTYENNLTVLVNNPMNWILQATTVEEKGNDDSN